MSKSIYEEIFNYLDELVDVLEHIEGSFLYRNYLDNIRLKLKQAQKQEKLLGLYKELNNKSKELLSLAEYHMWDWKLYTEIKDIQDKIKELENENNR